jgi:hypothetical protein
VWRGADAPRVEILRTLAAEQLAPLGEEGPALVEEGLERTEVHLGRIGLDLAEIGVHRRVEREVRAHAQLGVESHAAVPGVIQRVRGGRAGAVRRIAGDVRHELHRS